jgi:CDP-diacylglycerol---glycerol-3-phosphate 3-phosphatidyltransferase
VTQPTAVSRWNLANQLTVLRLLLVPVLAWLLFQVGAASETDEVPWSVAAFLVFIAASATDSVDGEIARRRGLITDFGIVADPIADKALTGTALIGLSLLGDLPWWVTIAILVREFGITLLRFWVIRHGVIPASRGGKLKTLLQVIAIGLYLLPLTGVLASARAWVMGAAVIVTLITGVDYIARAVRLRRQAAHRT